MQGWQLEFSIDGGNACSFGKGVVFINGLPSFDYIGYSLSNFLLFFLHDAGKFVYFTVFVIIALKPLHPALIPNGVVSYFIVLLNDSAVQICLDSIELCSNSFLF